MKERLWQIVLLALVAIGAFAVLGLGITDLDALGTNFEELWKWVKGLFNMDPSSMPDLPIPTIPKPRFMF